MIKLSEKHKDKLIGGIIGAFIIGLTLLIKSFFAEKVDPKPQTNSTNNLQELSPVITNTNKDNAKQTINQIQQQNKDNGKITNEFVSGDKKTYNSKTTNNIKKDSSIINNGFLNQGGLGNTYNQTINTEIPQRHFSENDFFQIKYNLNQASKYLVVVVHDFDKESTILANEIINYFEKHGYQSVEPRISNKIGFPVPEEKKGKMELFSTESPDKFVIDVYPLY